MSTAQDHEVKSLTDDMMAHETRASQHSRRGSPPRYMGPEPHQRCSHRTALATYPWAVSRSRSEPVWAWNKGSSKLTVVPLASSLSTEILPPISWTYWKLS